MIPGKEIEENKSELSPAEQAFVRWLNDNLHDIRMKKTELAAYMGVSRQAVTNWTNRGAINREHLSKLEVLFKQRSPFSVHPELDRKLINASIQPLPGGATRKRHTDTPQLSWEQAIVIGTEAGEKDLQVENWICCPNGCSENTFAVIMKNRSMEPNISEGDTLFVDPEMKPNNSSFVLAHTEGDAEAVVRQFISENGRSHLVATNQDWVSRHMEMCEKTRIIGVVIAKYRQFS